MNELKLRTIITQDAEVDDQNSLRHFLLYANEVELQGIVQTSSVFHWQGKEGTVGPKTRYNSFTMKDEAVPPYDKPFRWTGTQWMFDQIDQYEQIYPFLSKHAEGYPTADYLRSIVKVGNVGYTGDMSGATEGSELIRERILDEDPRTLYLQVWGGTNTIAQALKDIEDANSSKPDWAELKAKISKKVVITACGEQDDTYRDYIAESWPELKFVVTLQMWSYAYFWLLQPECESKDSLRGAYMKEHILLENNPLMKNYCSWLDGKYYEGEDPQGQFGVNEWTADMLKFQTDNYPVYSKYDFISEGDSPTFFWMFDWGFRSEEDFSYGGVVGRYYLDPSEKNSRGESLNYWKVINENFTDCLGNTTSEESMWRYVRDIQHDMAARAKWGITDNYSDGEHAPELKIREGLDLMAKAGEKLELHADARNVDGGQVTVSAHIYGEASKGETWKLAEIKVEKETMDLKLPAMAKAGDTVHVIVRAEADGPERLRPYQQIIVTVA